MTCIIYIFFVNFIINLKKCTKWGYTRNKYSDEVQILLGSMFIILSLAKIDWSFKNIGGSQDPKFSASVSHRRPILRRTYAEKKNII